MSHIKPTTPRARVTDHAVRRYVERVLGIVVDEALDDRAACIRLRALRGEQQVDVARVRARIANVGGVILSTGRTSGDAIAYPEGVKFRLVDGVVVTVLARIPKIAPAGPVSQVPAQPRTVLELGEAAA